MLKHSLAVSASVAALLCAAPVMAATAVITVDKQSDLASNPGSAVGQLAVANGTSALGVGLQSHYTWLPTASGTSCPYSQAAPFQEPATGGNWCMTPPSKLDLRQTSVAEDYTFPVTAPAQTFTFGTDGTGNLIIAGSVGFPGFPYSSAGDEPITAQISGLTKGGSSVAAPNGQYKLVWGANTAGVVTSVKLLNVPYGVGWGGALKIMYSPAIGYVPAGVTGPANTDNHNALANAIAFACAAGIDVTDGPGPEAIASPIDINSCHSGTWDLTHLAPLPPLSGAAIGWDEGLYWVKQDRYLTPGSWDNFIYITPGTSTTDPNGTGYDWNPPKAAALWPTAPLAKVFDSGVSNGGGAGHNLVAIAFQSPVVVGKGQLLRIHGSNVGGANPSYLEGLQTVYDIAGSYEGCSIAMPHPCAVTGVILANTDTSMIATLPQYEFASMQKSGTAIQVNLPYQAAFGAPSAGSLTIANQNYDQSLLTPSPPLSPKTWSFTNPSAGVYVLTGSTFPGGGVSPVGLQQATVAIGLPHGMLNFGYSNLSGVEVNTNGVYVGGNIDCGLLWGCVPVTNYSDADSGNPLNLTNLSLVNWDHLGTLTWGEGARTFMRGGTCNQRSGGPGAYGSGTANSIGTLGNRTGICINVGNTGDNFYGDGLVAAYNLSAWLTEADTNDIAIRDLHTSNGLGFGSGGPYYPNTEGIFSGNGSLVSSIYDGGMIKVLTVKGFTPYVQLSANWNYPGGLASMVDAPLVYQDDCWGQHCAQWPNVTGQSQGIDPNQMAAGNVSGNMIGGYEYGQVVLEDASGNVGTGRTWSQNSLAASAWYNSAINSYDNQLTTALSGPAFDFTANALKAQTMLVTTATTASTSDIVTVASTANLLPGMNISGWGVANNATVSLIINATQFQMSAKATGGGIPSGASLALPHVVTTTSAAVTSGTAIPLASTSGVFAGMTVIGPPAPSGNGTPAIPPTTTVLNVDAASNTVYLSLPLAGGGLASGAVLAFQGSVPSFVFGLNAASGYALSSTSLFPVGGGAITDSSGPLSAGSFQIASVQPWSNTINLLQSSNGNVPPTSGTSGINEAITIAGDSAHWHGTLTAGKWQITNVRYGTGAGVPISNLTRPGMVVTASCLSAAVAPWWIDGVNFANDTVQLENAFDAPLDGACTNGSTFTVTPSNYVAQAPDAGLTLLLTNNPTTNFQLYLQPKIPQGWSFGFNTTAGGPPIAVQVLNGDTCSSGPACYPQLDGIGVPGTGYAGYVKAAGFGKITNAGGLGLANYVSDPGAAVTTGIVTLTTGVTLKMAPKQGVLEVLVSSSSSSTPANIWLPPNPSIGDTVDVINIGAPATAAGGVNFDDGAGFLIGGAPVVLAAYGGIHFVRSSGEWTVTGTH